MASRFPLARELFHFVQVLNSLEAGDFDLGNVTDGKISVQTIFKDKVLRGGIDDRQFQGQFLARRSVKDDLAGGQPA
jgi:hypothetical protein